MLISYIISKYLSGNMNVFESLISEYTGGKPKHFESVASQLREGVPSLRIRDQLMEQLGLSRMAAGKIVEDVEKTIKAAKVNMATGAGIALFGLVVFLLNPTSIGSYVVMFVGTIQFIGGLRGWRSYQQAGKGAPVSNSN